MKNRNYILSVTVLLCVMTILAGCKKTEPAEPVTAKEPYKLSEDMVVTRSESPSKWIKQEMSVGGIKYSLTLNLDRYGGYTTEEQLINCTDLFWSCYPAMYQRFAVETTPRDVNLLVENADYEIADSWDNNVHIHDRWLYDNPQDYDCLTHEFAHVIQTEWDGDYTPCEDDDTYLIERFADYCRYVYAYRDGYYNDMVWTLQTSLDEDSYVSGVRFWVWLDYICSNDGVDIIKRIQQEMQNHDDDHLCECWNSDGPIWQSIFEGTVSAGKTLNDLWEEYDASDFSKLDSNTYEYGSVSELNEKYDVRNHLKK